MVVGIFAKELFKVGVKAFTRYYRAEGKAFNRLYSGFPQSRRISAGVRHGLTAGSLIGNIINDDGTPESTNGISKRRFRTPSNRFSKTRRRFQQRTRRKYKYCPPTKYRRR